MTTPADNWIRGLHPYISDGVTTLPPRGKITLPGAVITDDPTNDNIIVDQTQQTGDTQSWVPTSGKGQKQYTAKLGLQTTNNTTATMETFALPDATVTSIYVTVTAREVSGTGFPDAAEFQLKGVWNRAGGSPVQVKAPTVVDSNPNANGTAWTAVLVISGNNALIHVTGDTGKTINWTATRVAYEGV